jgi:hypothetical protein
MSGWEVWNPARSDYVSQWTVLPLPLLHDRCMGRTTPLSHLAGIVSLLKLGQGPKLLSILNRCRTDLWQSDRFSFINTIHFNISLFQLPTRKSKHDLIFRLSLSLFLVRSLGCLELFSNSHFSVFGSQETGLASCPTIMRTIWSEWTRAW